MESTLTVRALQPDDVVAARAFLLVEWDRGNTYVQRMLDRLDASSNAASREELGLSALVGDDLVGVALFGLIEGTKGTAKLFGIAVREDFQRQGVAHALLHSVLQLLIGENARRLIAEVADDAVAGPYQSFLRVAEFKEEARIPDYYRDSVAQIFFRRDLNPEQLLGT